MRTSFLGLLCLSAFFAIVGCADHSRNFAAEGAIWKEEIAKAFEQNEAITSTRFSGAFAAEGIGSAVPALLADEIRWEGFVQQEPRLSEGKILFGSTQEQEPREISFLLEGQALYFHLPLLNQPDEYFFADTGNEEAEHLFSYEALTRATTSFFGLLKYVVSELDPEWVRLEETDGSEGKEASAVYRIAIHEENAEAATAAFQKGWSDWAEQFPKLPPLSANGETEGSAGDIAITEGTITLAVSPDGYLTEQRADLTLTSGKLHFSVTLDGIHETFELKQPLPEQTLAFDHVLRFLAAGQQSEK